MEYIWNLICGTPEEEKPAQSGMKVIYTKCKDGFEIVKERDIFEQPYTSSSSSEDSSDDEDKWFEVSQELAEKCKAEEEKKRLEEKGPIQSESPPNGAYACLIS